MPFPRAPGLGVGYLLSHTVRQRCLNVVIASKGLRGAKKSISHRGKSIFVNARCMVVSKSSAGDDNVRRVEFRFSFLALCGKDKSRANPATPARPLSAGMLNHSLNSQVIKDQPSRHLRLLESSRADSQECGLVTVMHAKTFRLMSSHRCLVLE
jgi:hypothetical protein